MMIGCLLTFAAWLCYSCRYIELDSMQIDGITLATSSSVTLVCGADATVVVTTLELTNLPTLLLILTHCETLVAPLHNCLFIS